MNINEDYLCKSFPQIICHSIPILILVQIVLEETNCRYTIYFSSENKRKLSNPTSISINWHKKKFFGLSDDVEVKKWSKYANSMKDIAKGLKL